MHFASLIKKIGFTIDLWEFGKIAVAMLLMGYSGSYIAKHWFMEVSIGQLLTASTFISTLLYFVLLVAMRVLGKQDVRRIPWIGEQLAVFFPRR